MKPNDLVEQLLNEGTVYIRVGSPEDYEPEGDWAWTVQNEK